MVVYQIKSKEHWEELKEGESVHNTHPKWKKEDEFDTIFGVVAPFLQEPTEFPCIMVLISNEDSVVENLFIYKKDFNFV